MSIWSDVVKSLSPYFYYSMSESSGTTIGDRSGNGRSGRSDATTMKLPSLVSGDPYGYSVEIQSGTAVPAYINVNAWSGTKTIPELEASHIWTYKAGLNGVGHMLRGTTATDSRNPSVEFTNSGGVRTAIVRYGNSDVRFTLPESMFEVGAVTFLALTLSSSSIRLYLNGSEVLPTGSVVLPSVTGGVCNSLGLKSGSFNGPSGGYDEWAFFDRVLTTQEVSTLWDAWQDTSVIRPADVTRYFISDANPSSAPPVSDTWAAQESLSGMSTFSEVPFTQLSQRSTSVDTDALQASGGPILVDVAILEEPPVGKKISNLRVSVNAQPYYYYNSVSRWIRYYLRVVSSDLSTTKAIILDELSQALEPVADYRISFYDSGKLNTDYYLEPGDLLVLEYGVLFEPYSALYSADLTIDLDYNPNPSFSYNIENVLAGPDGAVSSGLGWFEITYEGQPLAPVESTHQRLVWDKTSDRIAETGLDRGVLYPRAAKGIPWNGLVDVSETGGEGVTAYYNDGRPVLFVPQPKEYTASLKAHTYPDALSGLMGLPEVADGLYLDSQQSDVFDLSYRTLIGNSSEGLSHGYKIHLVYNATVVPSEKTYSTLSDSLNFVEFSWDIQAVPVSLAGYRPTAHIVIDSRHVSASTLRKIENMLYGSVDQDATMPSPEVVLDLLSYGDVIIITDNGDGTWTAEGSQENVYMVTDGIFQIDNVDATDAGNGTYLISTTTTSPGPGAEQEVVVDGGTPSSAGTDTLDGGGI